MEQCFYTVSTDEKSQINESEYIDSSSLKRFRNQEERLYENKEYRQIIKNKCKERKKKIQGTQQINIIIPSKNKLKEMTKEERAEIQKIKNRQSAQKARDNKKQYILNVENKVIQLTNYINQLKQQLHNEKTNKFCSRCKSQIDSQKQNTEQLFPFDEYLERISMNSDKSYGILTFTIFCIFLFFNMNIGQKNQTALVQFANENRLLMSVQKDIQDKHQIQIFIKDYNVPAIRNELTQEDKCLLKFFNEKHQPITFYERKQKKKNLRLNSLHKFKSDIIHCGNPRIFKFQQKSNFYQQQSIKQCLFSRILISNSLKWFNS